MTEIKFIDTSLRDGNQSLWDATGIKTGMILSIAPVMDKDAHLQDVQECVEQARKIYDLYAASDKIQIFSPDDYNRLSPEMREKTYEWLQERLIK